MNIRLYFFSSALAVLLASTEPADAHASEASMEVKLEMTDETRQLKPVQLALTLNGAEGCASVDDRNQSAELHVQVCRDGGEDRRPVLSFHVERVLNLDKGTERRQFRVKLRVVAGRPQRIGRFGEGATAMELVATASIISASGVGAMSHSP